MFEVNPIDLKEGAKKYLQTVGLNAEQLMHTSCWYYRGKLYIQVLKTHTYYILNCGSVNFEKKSKIEEVPMNYFWDEMKEVRKGWLSR